MPKEERINVLKTVAQNKQRSTTVRVRKLESAVIVPHTGTSFANAPFPVVGATQTWETHCQTPDPDSQKMTTSP